MKMPPGMASYSLKYFVYEYDYMCTNARIGSITKNNNALPAIVYYTTLDAKYTANNL